MEETNYDGFRMVIELCVHIQKTQVNSPVLSLIMDIKDDKQETALLKSVRLGQMKMVFTFLHLVGPTEIIGY